MKMFRRTVLMMAATLAVAACVPNPPPPPPPGGGTTTTTDVTFACVGTGFAAGLVVPDQTLTVSITAPYEVDPGETFDFVVSYPTFVLASSPVDLNFFTIPGVTQITGSGGTLPASVSGSPVLWGPGSATATIPPAVGSATAGASGSVDIETGTVTMQVGSTGFVCTPVGGGATRSIPIVS